MAKLVSSGLRKKVVGLLRLAHAAEQFGFAKDAAGVFVMVGKMLPGKVCIESYDVAKGRVKFFLPETQEGFA